MRSAEAPVFLVVEVAGEHADQNRAPARWADIARDRGGKVFAAAAAGRVVCLEPGTVGASLMIARFSNRSAAENAARQALLPRLLADLPPGSTPTVLIADSLPDEGLLDLLDIPTAASVPRPPPAPRNMLLLVRGTAWDQTRLDAYRDLILPMHKERGGFYESFAIEPHQVVALSGSWSERIFAISRWPSRAAAEDFWFSERYQSHAIPLRLGAGRFTVHAIEALPD